MERRPQNDDKADPRKRMVHGNTPVSQSRCECATGLQEIRHRVEVSVVRYTVSDEQNIPNPVEAGLEVLQGDLGDTALTGATRSGLPSTGP